MKAKCKIKYPTYAAALEAMFKLLERPELGSVYPCERCGAHHISSRRFTLVKPRSGWSAPASCEVRKMALRQELENDHSEAGVLLCLTELAQEPVHAPSRRSSRGPGRVGEYEH
jgi:hypothetical protein